MTHDTDIALGPLAALIGFWSGDKGIDIAPEPDGPDENLYTDTIEFTVVDDHIENAEEQQLVAVHYHQVVRRQSTGKVFHDETGYWMWDAAAKVIMHSLVIPRGVGLLAGGQHEGPKNAKGEMVLKVSAGTANPEWPIMQSPFMVKKARTTAFEHQITVTGDSLSYFEKTTLDIYGRTFDHTDENILIRNK
ncbi:MAG: hypothetical protein COB54_02650 [Alphaproteobacteria bacterium]|nr:MAG: hypothetical protein COB54_02650 [Alphaproteobacteria bacterium]